MKIVVVGAGIGGMLVAEKLGGLGFDVVATIRTSPRPFAATPI